MTTKAPPDPALQIACDVCQKVVQTKHTPKGLRLPKGWKRHPQSNQVYCSRCWKKSFRLRAITFPVAECLSAKWPEFCMALYTSWSLATALSNWAVHELAKADAPRAPDQEKMAEMPKVNLYKLWKNHHQRSLWKGSAQSANCLLHAVEQLYRKRRLQVIWYSSCALPTYRYPVPYPVHNQSWKPVYEEYTSADGKSSKVPTVRVVLDGKPFVLRLRGGPQVYRQLRSFRQLVSGEAVRGELSLYRQRSSAGSHRALAADRAAGGGAKVNHRILCKLVAWLPRGPVKEGKGSLEVRTASNSLWLTFDEDKQRPWILHADQVRRWIVQHRRTLQRLADDTKAESRMPKWKKRQLLDRLNVVKHRHHQRLKTFRHTAARMLAAYAARCGVAEVIYHDDNRKYFSEFAWQELRLVLEDKLDEYGIVMHYIRSETGNRTGEDEVPPTTDEQKGRNADQDNDRD